MKTKYQPQEFEKKWMNTWRQEKLYVFDPGKDQKKFYSIVELPYTSGDLHIGHWFAFTTPDVLWRFKKMNGFNVFAPMGFDAFGLPAENAAIKRNIHPKDWTMKNIETMSDQFQQMGTMIDWDWPVTITCLPEYYKWNQWIFLKLYEAGLAYRGKALSNWCERDQTVLANENIENGHCWRCGDIVVQKEVEQWFLKITDYADKLIWKDHPTVDWPMAVRVGQNNWIGKSEGLLIDFDGIDVFTTRPETIDGATFVVLAPEHKMVLKAATKENLDKVKDYLNLSSQKTERERKEAKEKTGVFTGGFLKNPVTGKKTPVWVADYVLSSYGSGAIMAVPAEDERDREFAKKHNLPIVKTSLKAKPVGKKISLYHIRDWSISRQRYWGTPVPMIHCPKDGLVPVPYDDLPVELPYEVDFTPRGKPPLATNDKWLHVKCPKCGSMAKRDAETLDTFFDSAWYWFRYVSPKYDKGPFDQKMVKKFTPLDVYFGGAEHTLGHTLYARFFTKFFKDLGLLDYDEFALKRIQHGIVLGPDGNKMSKSKGNVINPDSAVTEYGSDTVRLYLCFMMPYEGTGPWSDQTIAGVNRFLTRIWNMYQNQFSDSSDKSLEVKLKKTIKKVTLDIENVKMNTAIAAMMEFLNDWEKNPAGLSKDDAKKFLQILSPFAPFMTEEIWRSVLGEKESVHKSFWPKTGEIVEEEVIVPVQVNGKVRTTVKIPHEKIKDQKFVESLSMEDEKVKKHLSGKPYKTVYVPGKILNFIVS